MSSRLPLFRPEALEHHRRGTVAGVPVRLGRPWTGAGFLLLVTLVGAALLAAAAIRVPSFVDGPAVTAGDGAGVVAVLPVTAVTAIRDGRGARLHIAGQSFELAPASLDVEVVDRPAASRTLRGAELDVPGAEVALLRGDPVEDGLPFARGARVRVQLPERRLLALLLGGFGDGDG